VVGVVCDEEIEIHKGPSIMKIAERAEIVAACKWVDEVASDMVPYNPTIPLIDKLKCDFVGHGDDMVFSADGKDSYWEIK